MPRRVVAEGDLVYAQIPRDALGRYIFPDTLDDNREPPSASASPGILAQGLIIGQIRHRRLGPDSPVAALSQPRRPETVASLHLTTNRPRLAAFHPDATPDLTPVNLRRFLHSYADLVSDSEVKLTTVRKKGATRAHWPAPQPDTTPSLTHHGQILLGVISSGLLARETLATETDLSLDQADQLIAQATQPAIINLLSRISRTSLSRLALGGLGSQLLAEYQHALNLASALNRLASHLFR